MKKLLFLLILCCAVTGVWADAQNVRPLAQGVQYMEIHKSAADGKPLAIYAIKIDRTQKNVSFRTLKGGDHVVGTNSPRNMGEAITSPDAEVIAAINADFYNMDQPLAGLTCGMIVRDGELMCSPLDFPAVGFDANGIPRIGVATMRSEIKSGTKSLPITHVNRPRDSEKDLVLFTPAFGKSTLAAKQTTDVVVSDITPALPIKPGVAYTGKVRAVKKNVTDDPIPADSVIISGAEVAAVGESISFSADLGTEWNGVTTALGGSTVLLKNGEFQKITDDEYLTKQRHPRSAIGWNDNFIYIVAVDGRDSGFSVGMDMNEIAVFMKEIGCTEALNLDGGGSTELAVRGDIVNHPSDGLDRLVSNGLAVVSSAKPGAPASIRVSPESANILGGSSVQLRVLGTDANGRPIRIDPQNVKWSLEGIESTTSGTDPDNIKREERAAQLKGTLGTIERTGLFTAANILRQGEITASINGITASGFINVWDKPAGLSVIPAKSTVKRGEKIRFSILATDRAGEPLIVDPSLVKWTCEGAKISKSGEIRAKKSGHVKVTATVAGVQANAELNVE